MNLARDANTNFRIREQFILPKHLEMHYFYALSALFTFFT
jgi:hypothetical protein